MCYKFTEWCFWCLSFHAEAIFNCTNFDWATATAAVAVNDWTKITNGQNKYQTKKDRNKKLDLTFTRCEIECVGSIAFGDLNLVVSKLHNKLQRKK